MDHSDVIISGLRGLRLQRVLTDVELRIQGRVVRCHANVLAAASELLRDAFMVGTNLYENPLKLLIFKFFLFPQEEIAAGVDLTHLYCFFSNARYEDMVHLVDYLYSGTLPVDRHVQGFNTLAEVMGIRVFEVFLNY